MRILLIASAFNSMTQRVFVELDDLGYDVACSVATNGDQMRAAVAEFDPELVVAPVPEDRDPRGRLARAAVPHRAPGHPRRPRAVVAGLGDPARPRDLGRDGAAGGRGVRRRRHLGVARVRGRRPPEERAVPRRGGGRRRRGRPRGDRGLPRRNARPRAAGLRRPERRGPAGAPDEAAPTGRSTGRRRRSDVLRRLRCSDSTPGVSTRSSASATTCSAGTPRARCAAARATCSAIATARSAARPATAPCGSRTSSPRRAASGHP